MKNWKKFLALLTALLLVLSFVACGSVDEEPSEPAVEQTEAPTNEMPTEMPTEAPTELSTEMPTEEVFDYTAFKGNWYSGKVTLTVKEDAKWVMTEQDETFMLGNLRVNEDGDLLLFDVEGVEAAKMILDADGSIYAELYVDELYSRIEDFTFTREKSEYVDMSEAVDSGAIEEIVDAPVEETPVDPAE